ncbi:MAG: hypothetical protein IT430_15975 [Phycisphaerales bacterium]|nr:hypothetical protein [Phycisphaerales bacterium]
MTVEHELNLVEPEAACPNCGERRIDELVWQNDEDGQVRCATCDFVYIPPNRRPAEGGDDHDQQS